MDRKKTTEMVMLGGALVLSLASFSAQAATGCSAGAGTSVAGNATNFVKAGFTPKCSASTSVNYLDAGADFAVQGASAKGKTVYGASTAGGQVSGCTTVQSGAPTVGTPGAGATNGCA
jgi:hypothetical protein